MTRVTQNRKIVTVGGTYFQKALLTCACKGRVFYTKPLPKYQKKVKVDWIVTIIRKDPTGMVSNYTRPALDDEVSCFAKSCQGRMDSVVTTPRGHIHTWAHAHGDLVIRIFEKKIQKLEVKSC